MKTHVKRNIAEFIFAALLPPVLLFGFFACSSKVHAQSAVADLTVARTVKFTGEQTPAQITADTNNYAPTNLSLAAVLRLSTDAAHNITGLTGGAAGRLIFVENVGAFDFTLKAASGSSTAANRFDLTADVVLVPSSSLLLRYDGTSLRWRAVGSAGGSGGGGSGTVTHTSGDLDAHKLIVGNGTDDVKALSDLGTVHKVLHGNASGDFSFGFVDLTADVTGTLPIGSGGTGQTTAQAALDALLPTQTSNSGKFLKTDGTHSSWDTPSGGGGTVADPTGTISRTVSNGSLTTLMRSDAAPAIASSFANQDLTTTSAVTFKKVVTTGSDGTGGSFGFDATNTNSAGKASITVNNDLTTTGGFGIYGSTFAITSFQDATLVFGGHNLIFVSDGGVSTSGSHTLDLQTGGYANVPSLRILGGNPGKVLIGTTSDDGSGSAFQVNGGITTTAPTGGTVKPWKLGKIASITPTLQNRTLEVEVDGTTYFLTAKTTND